VQVRHNDLGAVLAEVRRRWLKRQRLSAWTVGAAAAAMVCAVGAFTVWLLASEGLALALVALLIVLAVGITLVTAARPSRRPPSDLQLARYIEEQAGGLDDIVVTAVQHGDSGSPAGRRLAAEAARRVDEVGVDRVVDPETLRRVAMGAVAASLVLLAAVAAIAPTVSRGATVALAYLWPARLHLEVTPGTTKVRAGTPVTFTARVRGAEAGLAPVLMIGDEPDARAVVMTTDADGVFTASLERATESFAYHVVAGPARSDRFDIEVIRPVRVTRIDLEYAYPAAMGLPVRIEEDGGDIYGPAGTTVTLSISTDKPIAQGQLAVVGGDPVPLTGSDRVLRAALPIRADGSYRVALTDRDGLENPGETEYFIRMLDDRPPDVRVLRPGGDRQVTPVEEVTIEAAADDDFALASLEIVFQVPGQRDTVIPFNPGRAPQATGRHLIQLEELGVRPGDFVTYYARARDVGRGRQGAEVRSDIFFLEVKPFEETFTAAQSQAGGMQGSVSELQDLAEAQKEIISATWKLDARAARARNAGSAADIQAVAEAQTELKARAEAQASEVAQALADPRRRRPRPGQTALPGGEDPMARAVEAMGRAAASLDARKTREALPHEMAALEQLLKADSDVKQRQIARQQGGGGGSNRPTPDLSTLFDQQLRKQQETNYETPNNAETREEQAPEDDPLTRVRELARRQEGLQRAQQDLARNQDRLSEDEVKRQLERLTREQQQLTEQANALSKQMQQQAGQQAGRQSPQSGQSQSGESQSGQSPSGQSQSGQSQSGQSPSGQSQGQTSSGSRRLQEAAEQMRSAASELRRQDPDQASARSGRALEQLRDLSRQMERARPEERRRAMGDLQFEARQLADAERRLANEAERAGTGAEAAETRRRLAAEQERLADRTERLGEGLRELGQAADGAAGGDGDERDARQAVNQAARDLDREQLSERMRASADALRKSDSSAQQAAQGRELARALDKVAGQLGAAAGTSDRETERLSEQLARTSELRDRLAEAERAIAALEREVRQGQQGGRPGSDAEGQPQPGQGSQAGAPGTPGQQGERGESGGSGRGQAGLQRDAAARLQEAQRLAGELRQQNPEMKNAPATPENWYPSLSAPGTESFKQDFSRWEALKKNLLLALERTETRLSAQLRERESRERLQVGGHQGVADEYREMVDRYYESLATPRRPPR
jgi:hypothetical protein